MGTPAPHSLRRYCRPSVWCSKNSGIFSTSLKGKTRTMQQRHFELLSSRDCTKIWTGEPLFCCLPLLKVLHMLEVCESFLKPFDKLNCPFLILYGQLNFLLTSLGALRFWESESQIWESEILNAAI